MRKLRVQSGELGLAVYGRGDASRPTLILVHGYPDCAQVWSAVAERLAAHYHVVSYDVRGAGASDIPKRIADYKLPLLSQDLMAVADAVSPGKPFHLVAHDWGSMQSWEAVTDEHQQKRIASFTSISGPCLDHAGMWMRRRLRHPTPRNLLQYLGQMAKSWYMAMFQLPFIPELYWKLLGRFWPKFLKRTEGIRIGITDTQISDGKHGINLYRANILARLFFPRERRTTVPVQLIVPLKDPYASPVLFDELPYWVPNLTRHDVDAKHWLPLSHPEYLADRVMQFVGELQSGIRV